MKNLRKIKRRLHQKKGFTMMEMLIVVAIIAILIAVSVPIFTSQLDTAKKNTDMANQRAAKAVAAATYLTKDKAADTYDYDAVNGILVDKNTKVTGYGKCSEHSGDYLIVTIADDGTISMKWSGSHPDLDE